MSIICRVTTKLLGDRHAMCSGARMIHKMAELTKFMYINLPITCFWLTVLGCSGACSGSAMVVLFGAGVGRCCRSATTPRCSLPSCLYSCWRSCSSSAPRLSDDSVSFELRASLTWLFTSRCQWIPNNVRVLLMRISQAAVTAL